MRDTFLTKKVALTGLNFAIAETGEFVVCTNEGNADMGAHLADVHIACMGIEKLIPLRKHLGYFLRLLTRSATGQPITTYSSHFKKPRKGQEMHIVLVDNHSIHPALPGQLTPDLLPSLAALRVLKKARQPTRSFAKYASLFAHGNFDAYRLYMETVHLFFGHPIHL